MKKFLISRRVNFLRLVTVLSICTMSLEGNGKQSASSSSAKVYSDSSRVLPVLEKVREENSIHICRDRLTANHSLLCLQNDF